MHTIFYRELNVDENDTPAQRHNIFGRNNMYAPTIHSLTKLKCYSQFVYKYVYFHIIFYSVAMCVCVCVSKKYSLSKTDGNRQIHRRLKICWLWMTSAYNVRY